MGCGVSQTVGSRENKYLPDYLDGFEVEPIRWSGKTGGEVVKDLFANAPRLGDAEIIKVARITSNLMGIAGLRDLLPCKLTHNALCAMAKQCGTSDGAMWLSMVVCQMQRHPHGTTLFRSIRMEAAVKSLMQFCDTPESVKWVCNALSCCCDVGSCANQNEVESMLRLMEFATTDDSVISLAKRMIDIAELFSPKLSHTQRAQSIRSLSRCRSPDAIQAVCGMLVNFMRDSSVCEGYSTTEMRATILHLVPVALATSPAVSALLCLIFRLMRGSSVGCRLFASEPVVHCLSLLSSGVGDSASSEWWCRVAALVWESLPVGARTQLLPESSLAVAPFCSSSEAVCAFCIFVSATQTHSPPLKEVLCERVLDVGTFVGCDEGVIRVSKALLCTSHGAWNARVSLVVVRLMQYVRSTQAAISIARALQSFSFAGRSSHDEIGAYCDIACSLLRSSTVSDECLRYVAMGIEQVISTCGPTADRWAALFVRLLEGLVACVAVSTSSTLRAWCQATAILIEFVGHDLDAVMVKKVEVTISRLLTLSISLCDVSVLPLLETLGANVVGSDSLINERLRTVVTQLVPLVTSDDDVETLSRTLNHLTNEDTEGIFTCHEVLMSVLMMGTRCRRSLSIMWVAKVLVNLTFDHQRLDALLGNESAMVARSLVSMCSCCADVDVDSIAAESVCQALAQLGANYDVRRALARNMAFFTFLVAIPSQSYSSDFVRWYCTLVVLVASFWNREGLPSSFKIQLLHAQLLNLTSRTHSALAWESHDRASTIVRQL